MDTEPDTRRFSVITPINALGRSVLSWVNDLGAVAIFLLKALLRIFRPKQVPLIVQQIYYIGARSATIVMLVGLFTGMVLGLQLYYTLVKFGSAGVLGSAVALSLVRELGPVLTAIMITARAGSFGVEGTLKFVSSPVCSFSATKSVKVPPMSTLTLYSGKLFITPISP